MIDNIYNVLRLAQINNPEVSGYIVQVLLPYITGYYQTGQLTGQFYPLSSNPSGFISFQETGIFVTTNNTGNFLSYNDPRLISTIISQTNPLYYPLNNNPSGYLTNETGTLTGSFYPLGANPSGYLTTGSISGVGNVLITYNNNGSVTVSQASGSISGSEIVIFGDNLIISGLTENENIVSFYGPSGQNLNFLETGNNLLLFNNIGNLAFSDQYNNLTTLSQLLLSTGNTGNYYPLNSNPSGYITSGQTGIFATAVSLGNTGSYLFGLINASSAGVSSLNSASGALTLNGAGNISVFTLGQTITVSGNTGILTGMFTLNSNTGLFITSNQTGSFITNSQTGIFITRSQTGNFAPYYLGLPTIGNGNYGGNSSIAGIVVGDTYPNAYEKIELILEKLAPAKPLFLSASNFTLTGTTYTAYMQGTNTLFSNIIVGGEPTGYVTGFYDGSTGILSGFINNQLTGQFNLAPFLTGSSTGLVVYMDNDFYSGIAGKSNFWYFANASLSPSGNLLSTGKFSMELAHTTAGDVFLTGYNDFPSTPILSLISSTTGTVILHTIDGVPSLNTNDSIITTFNLSNAISAFYLATVATVSSSQTNTVNLQVTGFPLSGTILTLSGSGNVLTNKFISGWVPTVQGFSIKNSTSNSLSGSSIFIDSVSSQSASRVMAATGQYPSGFGTTVLGSPYNNNTSLVLNEELQMLDGLIQNPPSINYSTFVPSGPNYLTIQTGSYQKYRWCCFNAETISNASQVTIQFNNTNNFGSSAVIPNFHLYVYVSGGIPTNGWIDGNTAYPGVGNPTNNGDPALVIGSSTSTSKQVTFGSSVKNGVVFARIGIPSGSNLSFGSITAS